MLRTSRDGSAPTVLRALLAVATWTLTRLAIGVIIIRVQNGVWYYSTITVMTVSAFVVPAGLAVYQLKTKRARNE